MLLTKYYKTHQSTKKSNPEEHYHNQFDMSDILPSTIQGVK